MNAKNIVESQNIKVFLNNQYAAGGVGELPPIDNWLELWVVEDLHFDRALKLLDSFNQVDQKDWHCSVCQEENGGAFEFCWNCYVSG